MSVLSVCEEITVWCRNGAFHWREDGVPATHPLDDPVGAARLIARRHSHDKPQERAASYPEEQPAPSPERQTA
ncbi:hypothetical protein D5H75_26825 [Bailinhaonella thermotolerans]|uniref:Uncharacterized protein n=1 Tax=Bailinhaonella thermotolerans TaxID=1070861 RepID=A0A3A4ALC7_9ACTN|nr:hypothetical protein D5H75_26825 [Bailinhaonella thermotolerans]